MGRLKDDFDVAIIGGGAAGLMAAAAASSAGAATVIIEKNKDIGVKLSITGGGRCGISHNIADAGELTFVYGKNGSFLYSAFSMFGVKETMEFFNKNGLHLKIFDGGLIFPKSEKAKDVIAFFSSLLRKNGVKIIYENQVNDVEIKNGEIVRTLLSDGSLYAGNYIICTGGKSYPKTGSAGDGYAWAKKAGHKIIKPVPVLSPIVVYEKWIKDLMGISLENIELKIIKNQKKYHEFYGDIVFTHFGISGPAALDASREIAELLDGKVELKISIDIMPDKNIDEVEKMLIDIFEKNKNRTAQNALSEIFPQRLADALIYSAGVSPDKKVNSINKKERAATAAVIKGFEFRIRELAGFDRAMVTRGGVSLDEVDPKSMRSKLIKNLYFAGEILDIDAPCGGYNLQMCWSTGFVAGRNAAMDK